MKISKNVRVGFTVDGDIEISEYNEYTGQNRKVFLEKEEMEKIIKEWRAKND